MSEREDRDSMTTSLERELSTLRGAIPQHPGGDCLTYMELVNEYATVCDERDALRESMSVCNARTELVVALHTLASHFENTLGLFGEDIEARNHAEGSIRHAMQVAAKHNENGKGCLIYLPKPEDSSEREGGQ